ncbi:bifunctional 2-polyprenyl-6-hydroxyphenol methylase/3-demethylubiquinol 3-O-methyltransferase UbiG [Kineosporia sp. A_224]|uniref:class I SAM-dependent methyltransferase n=1 Tax=Kineosporia sp. A_224 TaxID=1962180 RepID=UPI000B4B8300|nr:class I SAM-dependent methyltransferase [Kineosporia sp. A_224]
MPTWDDAAQWYVDGVRGAGRGFNDLAARVTLDLLGGPDGVAGRRVLDLGCGEGHVARRLARLGARVVAVEPTVALLDAARAAERAGPLGIDYRPGAAEDLGPAGPGLGDATLDAVCAVLVLHHVADLDTALGHVHRVLRPGGALVVVLPHPWTDHDGACWVPGPGGEQRAAGAYAREGYWSSGPAVGAAQPAPLTSVREIGWYHRTLGTWLTALARAGLVLDEVREPAGDDVPGADPRWAQVPRFLALRAVRA